MIYGFIKAPGFPGASFEEDLMNIICNRIMESEYAQAAEELRNMLEEWQEEKEDPIIKGDIPIPQGNF